MQQFKAEVFFSTEVNFPRPIYVFVYYVFVVGAVLTVYFNDGLGFSTSFAIYKVMQKKVDRWSNY